MIEGLVVIYIVLSAAVLIFTFFSLIGLVHNLFADSNIVYAKESAMGLFVTLFIIFTNFLAWEISTETNTPTTIVIEEQCTPATWEK